MLLWFISLPIILVVPLIILFSTLFLSLTPSYRFFSVRANCPFPFLLPSLFSPSHSSFLSTVASDPFVCSTSSFCLAKFLLLLPQSFLSCLSYFFKITKVAYWKKTTILYSLHPYCVPAMAFSSFNILYQYLAFFPRVHSVPFSFFFPSRFVPTKREKGRGGTAKNRWWAKKWIIPRLPSLPSLSLSVVTSLWTALLSIYFFSPYPPFLLLSDSGTVLRCPNRPLAWLVTVNQCFMSRYINSKSAKNVLIFPTCTYLDNWNLWCYERFFYWHMFQWPCRYSGSTAIITTVERIEKSCKYSGFRVIEIRIKGIFWPTGVLRLNLE